MIIRARGKDKKRSGKENLRGWDGFLKEEPQTNKCLLKGRKKGRILKRRIEGALRRSLLKRFELTCLLMDRSILNLANVWAIKREIKYFLFYFECSPPRDERDFNAAIAIRAQLHYGVAIKWESRFAMLADCILNSMESIGHWQWRRR